MSTGGRWFAFLPALLVGLAAAVAAEVAVGILLYADGGLMRSLSTVLVTAAGALAIGLWTAPPPGPDLVEQLRRRWLMCLITFVVAAAFGTSWTFVRELGTGAIGQGAGLAALAALPLYTCGTVLGALAVQSAHDSRGPQAGPGAPAALGAALGFAATGMLLPRAPMPSSLLIGCLVLLAFGGMVYGILLEGLPRTIVRGQRTTSAGEVSVEDRTGPSGVGSSRVLIQSGHVRRRASVEGTGRDSWDVAVARALMPSAELAWRVLLLGGGASSLPRFLLRDHPTATVDVLEQVAEVVDLGRTHFETELEVGRASRISVRVGNLDDLAMALDTDYDMVIVDGAALGPLGGSRGLSGRSYEVLVGSLSSTGLFVYGPGPSDLIDVLPGWQPVVFERPSEGGFTESLAIAGPAGVPPFAAAFAGFTPRDGVDAGP